MSSTDINFNVSTLIKFIWIKYCVLNKDSIWICKIEIIFDERFLDAKN